MLLVCTFMLAGIMSSVTPLSVWWCAAWPADIFYLCGLTLFSQPLWSFYEYILEAATWRSVRLPAGSPLPPTDQHQNPIPTLSPSSDDFIPYVTDGRTAREKGKWGRHRGMTYNRRLQLHGMCFNQQATGTGCSESVIDCCNCTTCPSWPQITLLFLKSGFNVGGEGQHSQSSFCAKTSCKVQMRLKWGFSRLENVSWKSSNVESMYVCLVQLYLTQKPHSPLSHILFMSIIAFKYIVPLFAMYFYISWLYTLCL